MDRRADIIGKGQVIGGQDGNHAGGGADGVEIDRGDCAASDVGQPKGQMQCIGGQWDVIDIARGTGHVEASRVMGQGACNGHGRTSSTFVGTARVSRKYRSKRLRATFMR